MTEELQEDYLLVHYLKGLPHLNEDGYWEIDCYVEYQGEYSDDCVILDDKESAETFVSYFKTQGSITNPLRIKMNG